MLKAGVIGAGVFGGLHARKYADLPDVEFVGVYDPHPDRAAALAHRHHASAFDDPDALIGRVDVVTVASPGETHAALAGRVLDAGRHVYVEKPLATTLDAAEALVQHAERRRLVLACGHQERVVFSAMGLLGAPETPLRIESVRRGTPNARNRDISCVLDLMIHDLDLVLALGAGAPLAVEAEGGFDEVRAEVAFSAPMHAAFEASRIAERRERRMRIDYPSGEVIIDFLAPAFENHTAFALNPDFAATPAGHDPLGASIAAFLAAVRGEADRPFVAGEEGLAALELALRVEHAAFAASG